MHQPFIESFDVETNTNKLKALCAMHDSDTLVADITQLLTLIETPRIRYWPFTPLDSPFRQLLYIASLNLTSDPNLVENNDIIPEADWEQIVKYCVGIKAGYYEMFLPKENDDPDEYAPIYSLAMPVFMDYYNRGTRNYEEQDIERIISFFTPYDEKIRAEFGLTTQEFVDIYNLIDEELFIRLNEPIQILRNDAEVSDYLTKALASGKHPFEWKYDGANQNLIQFLKHANTRSEKFTVDIAQLAEKYDKEKLLVFLTLFTIQRGESDLLYYNMPNPVLERPIYKTKDGRYLIISSKQLITSIYEKLTGFASAPSNKLEDSFYRRRGKILEQKVEALFNKYSGGQAFIYSSYSTSIKGEEQDILVLWKSIAFIIEAKAGKVPEPMRDIKRSFKKIAASFKRSIQEGYNQAYRIKKMFDQKKPIEIFKDGKLVYTLQTKKYSEYFPIIITLNSFSTAQIDLSHLLKLDPTDDRYPTSISIDELEILLLTLIKKKKNLGFFVWALKNREQLQGRLKCNDELELWGAFINNKNFKVSKDPNCGFQTFPEMADFYDEIYETGFGFNNEKNMDRKSSGRYVVMGPSLMEQWKKFQTKKPDIQNKRKHPKK